MRDILFRGKSIDGTWHYGVPLVYTEDYVCIAAPHSYNKKVESITIGQYTGLTDKNGKEIFEGDIVESVFTNKPYIVWFGEYTYTDEYGEEESAYGWYNEEKGGYVTAFGCPENWATIIGNIHDNPEILKGGDGNA